MTNLTLNNLVLIGAVAGGTIVIIAFIVVWIEDWLDELKRKDEGDE